jgi:hypothetical protein
LANAICDPEKEVLIGAIDISPEPSKSKNCIVAQSFATKTISKRRELLEFYCETTMNEILGLMKPGKRKDLATKFWKIVIQFVQFLVAGREIDPRTDMKMLLQLDAVCRNVTVVIKKPGRQGINKKLNDKIQNSPRMIRELIKNKNPTNPC